MMDGTRKILVYGVIGILAATVLSSSILMLPNLLMANAKTGTLVVKVTDAPVPDLEHLDLTISSVYVLSRTEGWVPLTIEGGELSFDLLELDNVARDLAKGSVPVGDYLKIRLTIVTAKATLSDGTIDLNVPPGEIDLQVKFEIKEGETTGLVVDIIVDKAQIAEMGSEDKLANLNPQFKLIVIPPDTSS